jgi:phosphate-selective porin OprO/OprP
MSAPGVRSRSAAGAVAAAVGAAFVLVAPRPAAADGPGPTQPDSPNARTVIYRAEAATAPLLEPLLIGEFDLRFHSAPNEVEGNNGFAMRRIDLGAYALFTDWASALASVEFANREGPIILDAFLSLRPLPFLELNLGPTKTPLFSSAHDEFEWMLPIPELPMVVQAFWPGHDAGVEAHLLPVRQLPLEAWLRVGNGSGSALGNDNSDFAVDGRLDATVGRAAGFASPSTTWGLRVGGGAHAKSQLDQPGITGQTADGFEFYHPVTVSGPRYVTEGHVVVFAGPLKITSEAAFARESRSADVSGNPSLPSRPLPAIYERGIYAEAAWMVTGQHRVLGAWPVTNGFRAFTGGAVEVAGRVERLDLGLGAPDVTPGGATAFAFAVRWWATRFFALSAAGYHTRYDSPPIEEPTRQGSWLGMGRVTILAP